MTKPISVGVVGCGYWGPLLVRNLKGLPSCRLKAVCDVQESRLKHIRSLYSDVEGVTGYDQLLNGVGLDAVVIATPVKHHFSLAKASLQAGKHTLIEKPMASSSAECEELIEIAKRNGLVLMVGHTFLYSSAVRKIVEIIQAGDIGDIRYINSRRLNLGLFQKDINVAWDLAPHDISIILHILGEFPMSVNCSGNAHVTPHIEDVTNMSLTFPSQAFRHDPEQLARTAQGPRNDYRRDSADDRLRRLATAGKDSGLRCARGASAALQHLRGVPLLVSLRRQLYPVHRSGRTTQDGMPAFHRLHRTGGEP